MGAISITRQMSAFLHLKEGFSEVQFSMTPTIPRKLDQVAHEGMT